MAADKRAANTELLRKLAEACRNRVRVEKTAQLKTAGHVLRAAKGLTLLREKVRS